LHFNNRTILVAEGVAVNRKIMAAILNEQIPDALRQNGTRYDESGADFGITVKNLGCIRFHRCLLIRFGSAF
jgi:hypothetical protein